MKCEQVFGVLMQGKPGEPGKPGKDPRVSGTPPSLHPSSFYRNFYFCLLTVLWTFCDFDFFFLSNLFLQLLPVLKVKQNCTSSSSHQNWNWQKGSAEPCQLYAVTQTNKERLGLLEKKMPVLQISTTNTEQTYILWMDAVIAYMLCMFCFCLQGEPGAAGQKVSGWVQKVEMRRWCTVWWRTRCWYALYDMQTPGTSDTEARLGVASPAICCLGH